MKCSKSFNLLIMSKFFFLRKTKNHFDILTTDDYEKIFSFIYNDNGRHCTILVPDLLSYVKNK